MQEPRLGYEYWPLDAERLVLATDPLDVRLATRMEPDDAVITPKRVGASWRAGGYQHFAFWEFASAEVDGRTLFIHTPVTERVEYLY